MYEQLEKHLREIVADIAGLDPVHIDRSQPLLRGGLELDSLTVVSLVSAIEAEYRVDILNEDLTLASFESLAALAEFIGNRIG